jgi:hypothetical protein
MVGRPHVTGREREELGDSVTSGRLLRLIDRRDLLRLDADHVSAELRGKEVGVGQVVKRIEVLPATPLRGIKAFLHVANGMIAKSDAEAMLESILGA